MITAPLALVFDWVTRARNALYDHEVLRTHHVPLQVISVGNLSVGGSGKTPVTDLLVGLLKTRRRVAVLSRGYGGSYQGIERLNSKSLPQVYGDEPTWLAGKHPDVAVYVGRDRVKAALEIQRREGDVLLILDDGYQHRRLYRDLNILLVDVTEKIAAQKILPHGRLRESWLGARRAHVVILNKVNLVSREVVEGWRHFVSEIVGPKISIFEFAYEIPTIYEAVSGIRHAATSLSGQSLELLSGIAKPEVFEQMVRNLGARVIKHHRFADHYRLRSADLAKCGRPLLITEKDAIKLERESLNEVFVAELKALPLGNFDEWICSQIS